jgi:hypothetical protein
VKHQRTGPYRLHAELVADRLTVRESLRAGQVRAAAAAYRGGPRRATLSTDDGGRR